MTKRKFLLFIIFISLIFFSCSKSETELEIDEVPENVTDEGQSSNMDEDKEEENKPLISLSPSDTLIIMVRSDGAPGMYLEDDGEVHGFYVDLEKMVMEEMGQKYEFQSYEDVGPVAISLKSGTSHSALAAPDLPDYRSFLNLSIPYEILNYVTFVHQDNEEIHGSSKEEIIQSLYGKRVGVQTQGHIFLELREHKEIELIEYPTTTKALEDLDKGLIDAVPDVKRIGIYYAEKEGWSIKSVGDPIISHLITTAISQVFDSSLIERYNAALQAIIDDGRRDALYESYFGTIEEGDLP